MVYGQDAYGDRVQQVMDATGWSKKTVQNAASVGRKIPPSERRSHPNVTWTHHRVTAGLDSEERARYLDQVEEEGLTVRGLTEQIGEDQGKEFDDCPTCGGRCRIEVEIGFECQGCGALPLKKGDGLCVLCGGSLVDDEFKKWFTL